MSCSLEKLSSDDISHIHTYFTEKVPIVVNRFKSLNAVAARVVIQGLRFYGWTFQELSLCSTDLMKLVGKYVDLEALKCGKIRDLNGGVETHIETTHPFAATSSPDTGGGTPHAISSLSLEDHTATQSYEVLPSSIVADVDMGDGQTVATLSLFCS